jgi:hypothetical protein
MVWRLLSTSVDQVLNLLVPNNNLEDVVVGYGFMILWIKTNYVHDYG